MASSYPGGLDAFTNPTSSDTLDSVSVPHATQHTDLNDAVEAVQGELGTDPAGAFATVVARLNAGDTGPHLLSDGAVGAPAYSFSGDTDTGLYRIGANNFAAAVNGTKVLDVGAASLGVTGVLDVAGSTSTTLADLTFSGSVAISPGAATLRSIYVSHTKTLSTGVGSNNIYTLDFGPTYTTTQAENAGATVYFHPTFSGTGSFGSLYGMLVAPVQDASGGVTALYGIDIRLTGSGGATTAYLLRMGFQFTVGTTKWAIANDSTAASYTKGSWAIGNNTAPTWLAHLQGGNSATSGVGINTSTTGPTAPASNAAGVISIYKGATNYYLLITFNDAGTTRYKRLQLNGTGTTWTQGTTLPT